MRCLHEMVVVGTTRVDWCQTRSLAVIMIMSAGASAGAHADTPAVASAVPSHQESGAERAARMEWWRQARFGMFIHWGLYSVAAGEWNGREVGGVGEWILTHGQIPIDEYESLRLRFNPVDFDAKAWVDVARRAGMKYIVITSKHHDGFCLWPSALTEWDVAATPFGASGRDPLGELYKACEAAGIRLCFYHSIMDWHHPDYLPRRAWDKRDSADADPARFRAYLRGQLKELLERYPKIGVLWFDGEWEETWTHEDGCALDDLVRSLKSSIIINNRIDKGRAGMSGLTQGDHFRGDFGTPEQEIPAHGLPDGVDWESCMTMNGTWGFKANDHGWKSAETMIRMLVDIASKGGNFLLNVGPDGRGRIPQPSIERLDAIGRWLAPHGEAIYGTRANPLGALPWGRCTARTTELGGTRLYLFVFDWPTDGRLRVPGLGNDASRASVLGGPPTSAIRTTRDEDAIVIELAGVTRAGPCPVIALDLVDAPRVIHPPSINARSSSFVETIDVELAGARVGQQIRYTLDGTPPNAGGPIAGATVRVDRSCTLLARIFDGQLPRSGVASRSFTRVTPQPAVSPPPSFGPGPGLVAVAFERDRFVRVGDIQGAKTVDRFTAATIGLDRRPRDEHFALRFEGFVRVPQDGLYIFELESDDGSRLEIGNATVVDNDGPHERRSVKGGVALAAGWHPIRVDYFNAGGERVFRLSWQGPGIETGEVPVDALAWAP